MELKKSFWLAAGITGMLLGNPASDAQAELSIHIGTRERPERPAFVIDRRPDFINLRDFGFSISTGSPYDIIFYRNFYYIFDNGAWYCSPNYRGPWVVVREGRLPYRIKSSRWDDIRRSRDFEYRRHNRRFDQRGDRDPRFDDRRDPRFDDRNREPRFNNNDNRTPNTPPPPPPPSTPANRPNDGGRRN